MMSGGSHRRGWLLVSVCLLACGGGATLQRLSTPRTRFLSDQLTVVVSASCGHSVRALAFIESHEAVHDRVLPLPLDSPDTAFGRRVCAQANTQLQDSWRRFGMSDDAVCSELHRLAVQLNADGIGALPGWHEGGVELNFGDTRAETLEEYGLGELLQPPPRSSSRRLPKDGIVWRGQDIGF